MLIIFPGHILFTRVYVLIIQQISKILIPIEHIILMKWFYCDACNYTFPFLFFPFFGGVGAEGARIRVGVKVFFFNCLLMFSFHLELFRTHWTCIDNNRFTITITYRLTRCLLRLTDGQTTGQSKSYYIPNSLSWGA